MEFLMDIGSFGVKLFLVTLAAGGLLVLAVGVLRRSRVPDLGQLSVLCLDDHYRGMNLSLQRATLDRKAWKRVAKEEKKRRRETAHGEGRRVYVLDFQGDLTASAVVELREQVSAILSVARLGDEVVVRLESLGGIVEHYGLCAAQLARLRDQAIPLTVCVDRYAASGGYLMACVADRILAAPFATVGSIGILARIPNFNRLLRKLDVDYLEMTAGEHKRPISFLGEITEKGKEKLEEELVITHELFKDYVHKYRPALDIQAVSHGDHWYGANALALNLVDAIKTSDEFLMESSQDAELFLLAYEAPKSVKDKVAAMFAETADKLLLRWWQRLERMGLLKR